MNGQILIDTGPSERGWHRLEAFLRCPRLYAWGYGQAGSNPGAAARFPISEPLARGSIGHVGLAHAYAKQMAVQRREDPERYFRSTEAMDLVAAKFGDVGEAMLPIATQTVRDYFTRFYDERWEILGVEAPVETAFHGYRYTARVDLVYRDLAGKVWYMDHKLVNKIESKVQKRYCMSGQILGLWHLGAREWGSQFGGVQVNLLGCAVRSFLRFVPEPAPFAMMIFPETVRRAEESIAEIERKIVANEPIPMSPSEFTCTTSYGSCPAFELCRWGDGRAVGFDPEEEG